MTEVVRRIRPYQQPLHKYMMGGGTRAIEIAHRRWGKDEIALAVTCELLHQRPGSYWHCLPEYAQARKALWTSVNAHTGKRRIDEAFPEAVRASTNDQEMFIRFKNGSTWQMIGSDRYDTTVGAGVAGIVYSEWALANPSAWAYHRPMLEENNGWAMFITTPRGRNHAHSMYEMAKKNPRWFAEVSDVHRTGALSPAQLQESLDEYIAIYGEDLGTAQFQQEYECSFNAAVMGAFYAREMVKVRSEGRIAKIKAVPGKPVHRAWDIGVRDDTSIWWFQVVGNRIFVLDCFTASGGDVEFFAAEIEKRRNEHGWIDGTDFVPHDAKVKEWGIGRTRVESMLACGLKPKVCVNASKLDGINAARLTLARAIFHERCEEVGIPALEQYRREWDDERKVFRATEVHDWTSHLADAFRYLSLSWRDIQEEIKEKPVEVKAPPGYVQMPALDTRKRHGFGLT